MIYLFKSMPDANIDTSHWHMMLGNKMIRRIHTLIAYSFMPIVAISLYLLKYDFCYLPKVMQNKNMARSLSAILWVILLLLILLFHEMLHIVTIYKHGDVKITYRHSFVVLYTNAVLKKSKRILLIIFPMLILSAIPGIIAVFVGNADIKSILNFICWMNLILSGYDVANFFMVLPIPKHSLTYKNFYM